MSMSTSEWIRALGLFQTYPVLLIATFIIASAAFILAWTLRGYIDRAHIDTLKSRVAFYEAKLRENEQLKQIPQAEEVVLSDDDKLRENERLKQQVATLEREKSKLCDPISQAEEVVLSDDDKHVLAHISIAPEPDVDTMTLALGMTRTKVQYHLDHLSDSGLVCTEHHTLEGYKYFTLTKKGRQRVVEDKLIWPRQVTS